MGSSRIKSQGITPRKSLGQNFLIDDGAARRIVDAAFIQPDDLVFEIGPGTGALTPLLAKRAAHVIAIELDQTLIPVLQTALDDAGASNVTVVHGDALDVNYGALAQDAINERGRPFDHVRFVGNLPYYITSAAIRIMLEGEVRAASIVLTVQLEVAARAAAQPPEMSLLAVSVQFYGKPDVAFKIPPSAFYPQPNVDSAVLRIVPHAQPLYGDVMAFFRWAKAGFSQPRKQLRNTLASGLNMTKPEVEAVLAKAGIDPARRPETLAVAEWVRVAEAAGGR